MKNRMIKVIKNKKNISPVSSYILSKINTAKHFMFNELASDTKEYEKEIVLPYDTVLYEFPLKSNDINHRDISCIALIIDNKSDPVITYLDKMIEKKQTCPRSEKCSDICNLCAAQSLSVIILMDIENTSLQMIIPDKDNNESMISFSGVIHISHDNEIIGNLMELSMIDKDHNVLRVYSSINMPGIKDITSVQNRICKKLYSIIVDFTRALSDPKKFIVMEQATKYHHPTKKERPVGSPRYTLLNLGQIQKRYNIIREGEGTPKSRQFRRAHLRRLMSERFVHKQGQIIKIKHYWTGPTDGFIDDKYYKIIVDP